MERLHKGKLHGRVDYREKWHASGGDVSVEEMKEEGEGREVDEEEEEEEEEGGDGEKERKVSSRGSGDTTIPEREAYMG